MIDTLQSIAVNASNFKFIRYKLLIAHLFFNLIVKNSDINAETVLKILHFHGVVYELVMTISM